MQVRHGALREYLNGALWALPTISVVIVLAVGALLSTVELDRGSLLGWLSYRGNADAARQILTVVSGTMITVIALVFSLTIVALQISSTQFSPRLLRNFLRDRPIQVVLSVFVSTFAYSTAGLFAVGVERNGREFVPGVAVSGALLLGFASLGMLVFYIHHVAHSIQVDTIMEKVQLQTLAVAACMHPDLLAGPESVDAATPPADTPPDAFVTAHRPGYVQTVDIPEVTALAERYGCSIRVPFRAGQHVNRGTLVAAVWQRTPAGQPRSPALAEALQGAVRIGFERTLEQDVRFGIRQLVDIACKALSPAINDPYTAVQATDRLSVVLVDLAHRETGDRLVYDDEGSLLVAATLPAFDTYLDLACGQIRRYGCAEPIVAASLVRLLTDTGNATVSARRRRQVARQVRILSEDVERAPRLPVDFATVRTVAAEAAECFEQGCATPGPADRPRSAAWDFSSWASTAPPGGHRSWSSPEGLGAAVPADGRRSARR